MGEGLQGATAQQQLLDFDPEENIVHGGEVAEAPENPAPENPIADAPIEQQPDIFSPEGHQQALDEIQQSREARQARLQDNEQGEQADIGEDVGEDVGEDLGEDLAEDVSIGAFLGPVGETLAIGFGLFETFKSLFDEGKVHKEKLLSLIHISEPTRLGMRY